MVFITLSEEIIIYTKNKYLKTRSMQDKSCYTKFRNKLNSLIKVAKKNYLSYRFNKEKCNIKGTWKLINSLQEIHTLTEHITGSSIKHSIASEIIKHKVE